MRKCKMIMPKNQELYSLVVAKIKQLFDAEEPSTYDFICFRERGLFILSSDYTEFLKWPEPEIQISKFLTMQVFTEELLKTKFPDWINNQFIMGLSKTTKQWTKIIFSHIGSRGFISIDGQEFDMIAPLNNNYLLTDQENHSSVLFADIDDYDTTIIPGVNFVRDFDT